jgi:hypothetical protein
MKNMVKLIGVIVIVAVIGFSMTACEEPEDETSDLDGTWISTVPANGDNYLRIVAGDGKFTQSMASSKTAATWKELLKGTYPKDAKSPVKVTITDVNTYMFGETDQWYTWANLDSTYKGYVGSQTFDITISSNQFTVNEVTFQRQ